MAAGLEWTSINYPGTPAGLSDVMGGRVQVIMDGLPSLAGAISGGQLKLLAVGSAKRLPNRPETPTIAETLPGIIARARLVRADGRRPARPSRSRKKISDDLRTVLNEPALKKRFEDIASYINPMSPDRAARLHPHRAGAVEAGDRADRDLPGRAEVMRRRGIARRSSRRSLALGAPARAQDAYPNKTITMIVPFAAGGSTDVIGRLVAEGLRTVLGQPVVVDNRGGAGGSLGTAAIAKAPPDGYTIGMGTASTLAINPATYKNLPFDVLDDLSADRQHRRGAEHHVGPSRRCRPPTWRSSSRWRNRSPASSSYASPGHGSVGHLLGEQFKLATGTDLLHVPYRGMGPALNDAIGGQVQVIYDNLPTSLRTGEGRQAARARRCPATSAPTALPDVPTFGELGLDDINWMAFFGLIAPKDTPAPIVQAAERGAGAGAGDAGAARQARGAAGHRGRQFAGGVQGRDRARAGAHSSAPWRRPRSS